MNNLLDKIVHNNYRNYPLDNPILQQETDYIRNEYFKMLALILSQFDETTNGQQALFSRIQAGAGMTGNVAEYIHQARGLDINEYAEFMTHLRRMSLRYRFALDTILLSRCDGESENALTMTAVMLESLGMNHDAVEFLTTLAKSILEQDSNGVWNARDLNKGYCENSLFNCYTSAFVIDKIDISDSELIVRCESCRNILDIPNIPAFNNGAVKISKMSFENVRFPSGQRFSNCQAVQFHHCLFNGEKASPKTNYYSSTFGNGSSYLYFKSVKTIRFEGCTFKNHHGKLVVVYVH